MRYNNILLNCIFFLRIYFLRLQDVNHNKKSTMKKRRVIYSSEENITEITNKSNDNYSFTDYEDRSSSSSCSESENFEDNSNNINNINNKNNELYLLDLKFCFRSEEPHV